MTSVECGRSSFRAPDCFNDRNCCNEVVRVIGVPGVLAALFGFIYWFVTCISFIVALHMHGCNKSCGAFLLSCSMHSLACLVNTDEQCPLWARTREPFRHYSGAFLRVYLSFGMQCFWSLFAVGIVNIFCRGASVLKNII